MIILTHPEAANSFSLVGSTLDWTGENGLFVLFLAAIVIAVNSFIQSQQSLGSTGRDRYLMLEHV